MTTTRLPEGDHPAYTEAGRYMYTEDGIDVRGPDREVACGYFDSSRGGRQLCDAHEEQAKKDYPQGWNWYPGDRCRHGVYVGGSGIDHMCHACEMGYDDE